MAPEGDPPPVDAFEEPAPGAADERARLEALIPPLEAGIAVAQRDRRNARRSDGGLESSLKVASWASAGVAGVSLIALAASATLAGVASGVIGVALCTVMICEYLGKQLKDNREARYQRAKTDLNDLQAELTRVREELARPAVARPNAAAAAEAAAAPEPPAPA